MLFFCELDGYVVNRHDSCCCCCCNLRGRHGKQRLSCQASSEAQSGVNKSASEIGGGGGGGM